MRWVQRQGDDESDLRVMLNQDIDCRDYRFTRMKETILQFRRERVPPQMIELAFASAAMPQEWRGHGRAMTTCVMLDELESQMDSVKSVSKQLLDKALKR